jgi:hypothetical protein
MTTIIVSGFEVMGWWRGGLELFFFGKEELLFDFGEITSVFTLDIGFVDIELFNFFLYFEELFIFIFECKL